MRRILLGLTVTSWVLLLAAGRVDPAAVVRFAAPPPYRETIVHAFANPAGGLHPNAGLVADALGNLYGTTTNGSPYGYGVVFGLFRTNAGFVERTLYEFRGGSDGELPVASVIVDATGALYGTTLTGGGICHEGCGIAFKLSPGTNGYTETVLHRFGAAGDGAAPNAALLAGPFGALFGTTSGGGAFGWGTVFELIPIKSGYRERILYSFHGGSDGGYPLAAPIADSAGVLYGTAFGGGDGSCGAPGCGVVYELRPAAGGYIERVLHRFTAANGDGTQPTGSLSAGAAGTLFGTTTGGGACPSDPRGCGIIFKLTNTARFSAETVLHRFHGGDDGKYPFTNLVVGANNVLFGSTAEGGGGRSGCHSLDCGTVFEAVPAQGGYTERPIFAFAQLARGQYPIGGVIVDAAGKLYGATSGGDIDDGGGVVYELTP